MLLLYKMSSMYSQRKRMRRRRRRRTAICFKSGLHGGQLFCLPLLIHLRGNRQFRAVSTMTQNWLMHHFVSLVCVKRCPKQSATFLSPIIISWNQCFPRYRGLFQLDRQQPQWREGRNVRGPDLFTYSCLNDFIQQLEVTVIKPIDLHKKSK
jgi:hypothetical protein